MKKNLLYCSLILLVTACNKKETRVPDHTLSGEQTAQQVKTMQRAFPAGGLKAMASGPAAGSLVRMEQRSAGDTSQLIGFTPNAGTIWRDPATNETHLLALQLPHITGSQVKWASLGTGWEGSEAMAMDHINFYVVWKDAVYRIPKNQPNAWYLIIPDNGEDIKGIMGKELKGGYLARGNFLYSFTETGTMIPLPTQQGVITTTRIMAGFKNSSGTTKLSFVASSNDLWTMTEENSIISWEHPPYHNPAIKISNMAGNYLTQKLYQTYETNGRQIVEEDVTGVQRLLGNYDYSAGAPLVSIGANIWVMGNTLLKIRVDASIYNGVVVYREYGWEGVQLACANQRLIVGW